MTKLNIETRHYLIKHACILHAFPEQKSKFWIKARLKNCFVFNSVFESFIFLIFLIMTKCTEVINEAVRGQKVFVLLDVHHTQFDRSASAAVLTSHWDQSVSHDVLYTLSLHFSDRLQLIPLSLSSFVHYSIDCVEFHELQIFKTLRRKLHALGLLLVLPQLIEVKV